MSSVACTGSETRLVDCGSSNSLHGCSHINDTGVRCTLQTGRLYSVQPIREGRH